MMDWFALIVGMVPSLIVGIFLIVIERRQKKRDQSVERRVEARKNEAMLALDLQFATAKLSYAVACAVKNQHINGEIDEGMEAYELARARYLQFLNEQATEHLL